MIGLILSFVMALLMGMAVISLLWPDRRIQSNLLTKVSLAAGLGLGATSCLSFLYLVAARGHLDNLPAAEIVLLAILMTWAVLRRSPEKSGPALLNANAAPARAAPLAALAVFLMSAATFTLTSARWPNGDWDAWSIWNLHARFLYRAHEQWTALFQAPLSWSHADYPLLLPASVMRNWVFAGGETVLGPILLAFLFMAGAALLLFSALALLRGKLRASLAAILLLATPYFLGNAASQYADVPLAFFYLATLVLLCLADRATERRHGLLALAGFACGMAAWTKNEGLLFMVCVLLATIWTSARTAGLRTCWSRMWPFLVGLLPLLLIVLFFKIRYAPANDIFGPAGQSSALERLATPSRYVAVAEWLLKQIFAFGRWDQLPLAPISPVPLLLAALVLFGIRPEAPGARGPKVAAAALGMTLAGYLAVFLITPNALDWQLDSAGGRLLLHLWPSALFLFFLVLRAPFSESIVSVK